VVAEHNRADVPHETIKKPVSIAMGVRIDSLSKTLANSKRAKPEGKPSLAPFLSGANSR
jgi:hypothetical protein